MKQRIYIGLGIILVLTMNVIAFLSRLKGIEVPPGSWAGYVILAVLYLGCFYFVFDKDL